MRSKGIFYLLESSKFDCLISTEHNFIPCQRILMKFSENCYNISVYWPVQFYLIIFKINWFIAKTKRVSVQLGHSVDLEELERYDHIAVCLWQVQQLHSCYAECSLFNRHWWLMHWLALGISIVQWRTHSSILSWLSRFTPRSDTCSRAYCVTD